MSAENSKTSIPPLVISVVTLAAIFIVILGMQASSDILSPILLALVLGRWP